MSMCNDFTVPLPFQLCYWLQREGAVALKLLLNFSKLSAVVRTTSIRILNPTEQLLLNGKARLLLEQQLAKRIVRGYDIHECCMTFLIQSMQNPFQAINIY